MNGHHENLIHSWVISICGFTQSEQRTSGLERLWLRLRSVASSRTCVAAPLEWKHNWRTFAERVWRTSVVRPRITIVAYSWGCGHGFVKLARELQKRGLSVSDAVLCDPVYHSWLRPWRALFFSPAITIPANVQRVHWYRQNQNRPRGTDLVAEDNRKTEIEPVHWINATHQYADDHDKFHRTAMDIVSRAASEVRG